MNKIEITQGLNQAQKDAVLATEGPVLLLAGPGTGKTATLVRRTLHIISAGLAKPEEIILCSFTEKSAHELKERIAREARKFSIGDDLSGLVTGTIHGICNTLIDKHLHATPLGNNYDLLDETTQLLFIYQKFDEIVADASAEERTYIAGKYTTKWTAIKSLASYFDKITEELIDPYELILDDDEQTKLIGESYINYLAVLAENNKIDFANLQKIALDLLKSGEVIDSEFPKYVMVDEFQDTNFIQERLVTKLASKHNNLCVVGDEDQSLYRFRGATVESILNFPEKWPDVQTFNLDINYRSEPRIVDFYTQFVRSGTWEKNGRLFRFNKQLEPVSFEESDAPSVLHISADSKASEAYKVATFIKHLKTNGQISDYSQVAILLNSVKQNYSGEFINALQQQGIKAFCPRAKAFFENDEVGLVFAALAYIFQWDQEHRGSNYGRVKELAEYIDLNTEILGSLFQKHPEVQALLNKQRAEINSLAEGDTLDTRVADYIFSFLAAEPFTGLMADENKSRNVARLTQFLSIFHQFYGFPVISHKNLEPLKRSLFSSYLSYLLEGGADDYEDPDEPFPVDHVQIMTIHQAKGLEFPVIISGNMHYSSRNQLKEMHIRLGNYMPRTPNEPADMIGEFDSMRLFYVAFSRPQNLLVLSTNDEKPRHKRFDSVMSLATPISSAEDYSSSSSWEFRTHETLKKSYSFTSDIKAYETCSRQYHFFNQLEFSPSRAVTILFGTLVHQTIEDIHRLYIRSQKEKVSEEYIEQQFDFNYRMLQLKEVRFMAEAQKNAALRQIKEYWLQNRAYLDGVEEAEVDVSLEKENYVLAGSIDLVSNADGSFEILDFKTGSKPKPNDPLLISYYRQLCIYAHIYQNRTGRKPDNLVLYWTGEYERESARMVFPYVESDVDSAMSYFESVVKNIQSQNFQMEHAPDPKICNECDFKSYCTKTGLIR
jgi:DNA helicase-2/ATP-dependent DNA helicase PcrA